MHSTHYFTAERLELVLAKPLTDGQNQLGFSFCSPFFVLLDKRKLSFHKLI